ncbi:MAG: UMP kinase [Candidatus Altiarchaeales archaeon]|nr:UMP kinase [Candidatus Altiarchaeales archaeon]
MRIVFSLGGSILAPDEIDEIYLGKAADFLRKISGRHSIAVVVGGGAPAREKIAQAESGLSQAAYDWIGIKATRENAKALKEKLGDSAFPQIPETLFDAQKRYGGKILVMGGTEPGHSTDAVAALLADWVSADLFINASNIDYVYDRDPKKNKDAKPIRNMGFDYIVELVAKESTCAGKYPLLDLVAAKTIQRSRIKTIILDGRNLENMENAVEGREFQGTEIN